MAKERTPVDELERWRSNCKKWQALAKEYENENARLSLRVRELEGLVNVAKEGHA